MSGNNNIRADIQALRGYAVLIVLLYHAGIGGIDSGYLGVDIFFVISGFLITKILNNSLENEKFSFSEFYFRRARRILPAAYVTIFITSIISIYTLDDSSLQAFQKQVRGALTFTANFALERQSGYFDGSANLKPLLHMWSLSIEEQYYLLLPLAMFFLPKKSWLPLTFLTVITGFIFCVLWNQYNPNKAFFLLPSRAWELGIGSLGALLSNNNKFQSWQVKPILIYASVATLIFLPFIPAYGQHPGINALMICLATLCIILAKDQSINKNILTTSLTYIGNISYSLYLVHWPLFAFLNNVWMGDYLNPNPPMLYRFSLVVASFVLAVLLHNLIEQRFRNFPSNKKIEFTSAILIASVILMLLPQFTKLSNDTYNLTAERLRPNFGLSENCDYNVEFAKKTDCQTTDQPNIAIWGDSYAMSLVAGIERTIPNGTGLLQITKSFCGPFIGVAPTAVNTGFNKNWAAGCITFNDSAISYLSKNPSINTVVLSIALSQYLTIDQNLIYSRDGLTVPVNDELLLKSIQNTINELRKINKKVVIVSPPPRTGLNIGACLMRREIGILTLGPDKYCKINTENYRAHDENVMRILNKITENNDVSIISIAEKICNSTYCDTKLDEAFLYRDDGHLSYEGSKELFLKTNMIESILTSAR